MGDRVVNKKKRAYKTPWYDERLKILAKEKRNAFSHYKRNKTSESREQYVRVRNLVIRDVHHIREELRAKFIKNMERNVYEKLENRHEQIHTSRRHHRRIMK